MPGTKRAPRRWTSGCLVCDAMKLVWFAVLVALLGGVEAGNQTACNNTENYVSDWLDWNFLQLGRYPCVSRGSCPYCMTPEQDKPETGARNQRTVVEWGSFFDTYDCWGLRLRRTPGADPFATAPSKVDFVRDLTRASCNVSAVQCAFAYQADYCPSCPLAQDKFWIGTLVGGLGTILLCSVLSFVCGAWWMHRSRSKASVSMNPISPTPSGASV